MPEELEKNLEKPFDSQAFIKGEPAGIVSAEPTNEETPPPPENDPSPQNEIDEYWQEHIERMGDDYEVPSIIKTGKNDKGEKLTRKEKFDLIREEIYKNTDIGDDDFIIDYKKKKTEQGDKFSQEEYLKSKIIQQDISKMSDEDFLFAINKQKYGKTDNNPEGFDDDEIREDIQKMSKFQMRELRQNIVKTYNDLQEEQKSKNKAKLDEDFEKNVKIVDNNNSKLITNYLKNIEGKSNIDGIEFSEADLAQYKKDIPNMFKVNVIKENDGKKVAKIEAQELLNDIFSDEDKSMTFLPLLWMIKNNKLRGYTSSIKEKTKKQIIDKLDPNLGEPSGGNVGGSSEFNPKQFIQST